MKLSEATYKAENTANPISPNIFCADPTGVEYEGRLYVYGTNDQQQYEALRNSVLDAANNFREVLLDTNDPNGDALEIEDTDRQQMLSYLLEPGTDGRSEFDKDLSDPAALIELAWLRTHGRDTLNGISQYWKKELADTRKELAKTKKELEKYTKNNNNSVVVSTTKPNKKDVSTIGDIWANV